MVGGREVGERRGDTIVDGRPSLLAVRSMGTARRLFFTLGFYYCAPSTLRLYFKSPSFSSSVTTLRKRNAQQEPFLKDKPLNLSRLSFPLLLGMKMTRDGVTTLRPGTPCRDIIPCQMVARSLHFHSPAFERSPHVHSFPNIYFVHGCTYRR